MVILMFVNTSQYVILVLKGRISHFTAWQIRPFDTMDDGYRPCTLYCHGHNLIMHGSLILRSCKLLNLHVYRIDRFKHCASLYKQSCR